MSLHSLILTLAVTLGLAVPTHAQTSTGPLSYTPPPTLGTPEAWLDRTERGLVAQSGRVLTLNDPGAADPSEANLIHAVFYAPLSLIWILDGRPDTTVVRRAGTLERHDPTAARDAASVMANWEDGTLTTLTWPDPLPMVTAVSDAPHPLALFHDRLLTRPLTRPLADPLAGLPAGTRFESYAYQGGGGIIRTPGADGLVTAAEDGTGSEDGTGQPVWHSLGDHIVITQADGRSDMLHWRDLDAAFETRNGKGKG